MRAASHEFGLRQPTAGGALSPLAASLEFCLCPTARRIPARRSLGALAQTYRLTSERLSYVRRTPRAYHGACDRLRPGRLRASHAVCLVFPRSHRSLRSKRSSGHRRRLDNRKRFSGEFCHARRLTRHLDNFIRISRHESALHSTSRASELEQERNG